MVTIKRHGKIKIEIRVDHSPPHFHVVSPGSNFMIDLRDLTVIRGSGSSAELAWAKEWASNCIDDLLEKWKELNDPE